eukprot:COSAG03_NODE_498_length_7409_cov_13.310534_4_plen_74_part_00
MVWSVGAAQVAADGLTGLGGHAGARSALGMLWEIKKEEADDDLHAYNDMLQQLRRQRQLLLSLALGLSTKQLL